jgi:hypothetical protein
MMTACVIMHNMSVENERDTCIYDKGETFVVIWLSLRMDRQRSKSYSITYNEIHDQIIHNQL